MIGAGGASPFHPQGAPIDAIDDMAISAVIELGNNCTAPIRLAARIIRHLSRDEKRYGDQLARAGPIFRQSSGNSQRGSPLRESPRTSTAARQFQSVATLRRAVGPDHRSAMRKASRGVETRASERNGNSSGDLLRYFIDRQGCINQ